jgi:tRNA-guanine family transglycosylase
VKVVAGLSLKNLHPRVWEPSSPYHLPSLRAVMVSYAELQQSAAWRRRALEQGLRNSLGVGDGVQVFLDNGAFYFSSRNLKTDIASYREFVCNARPDWQPVHQDFIPAPSMSLDQQRECLERTMQANLAHLDDGYVPVIHVSQVLHEYLAAVQHYERLLAKRCFALGGIVPNLLRASKALPYAEILQGLHAVRETLNDKELHVFGMGGTATLHLAVLLGIDSLDSSGWRNRAARGIVQLPGSGDRSAIKMGSWRGREPDAEEWELLRECSCPPCQQDGVAGLKAGKLAGFRHRATHNLWVLLEEARWIEEQIAGGTYETKYRSRLDNSIYRPLIESVAETTGVPNPRRSPQEQR